MNAAQTLPFFHHGQFIVGGRKILWREKEGGEVELKEEGKDTYLSFAKFLAHMKGKFEWNFEGLRVEYDPGLQIINQLIAAYRPHALPDANGYYAAAAGVDSNGHLLVAVNNEVVVKHAFAGRGCAETTLLRKFQEIASDPLIQIKPVYLMSGRAEKSPEGTLLDKYPGIHSCPCGECRQNLRGHTSDFVMLPVNDGSKLLKLVDAQDASKLKTNQAWHIPHAQMYPIPPFRELDAETSQRVWEGYEAITDRQREISAIATELPEDVSQLTPEQYRKLRQGYEHADMTIPGLNEHPSLTNINRAMLQLIKRAYSQHAGRNGVPHIEITAVLVKTYKGEFYPSVLVNGDLWLPSKPPEIPLALSNAYNQIGMGEVYMMTFDNHQLQIERTNYGNERGAMHRLKMPDPAGLGRLLKNMKSSENATLRVIPLNDGMRSDAELRAISDPSLDVRQAFGPEYANPKRTVAAGRV